MTVAFVILKVRISFSHFVLNIFTSSISLSFHLSNFACSSLREIYWVSDSFFLHSIFGIIFIISGCTQKLPIFLNEHFPFAELFARSHCIHRILSSTNCFNFKSPQMSFFSPLPSTTTTSSHALSTAPSPSPSTHLHQPSPSSSRPDIYW